MYSFSSGLECTLPSPRRRSSMVLLHRYMERQPSGHVSSLYLLSVSSHDLPSRLFRKCTGLTMLISFVSRNEWVNSHISTRLKRPVILSLQTPRVTSPSHPRAQGGQRRCLSTW